MSLQNDFPFTILTKGSVHTEELSLGAFLLFDKPKGWSSFRGVKLVRWASGIKKVGHAGTLDPMATGLLVIGIGKATKSIEQVQSDEKEYIAEIKLGEATSSYDAETEVIQIAEYSHISEELIQKHIQDFIGEIYQKPPVFSALKKDGKRLYEYARKGQEVEIQSRIVFIKEIEVQKIELPYVTLRVVCGKGTYIRSLAHDLGIALNSFAHLTALRRTRIGRFHVNEALGEHELKQLFGKDDKTSTH